MSHLVIFFIHVPGWESVIDYSALYFGLHFGTILKKHDSYLILVTYVQMVY